MKLMDDAALRERIAREHVTYEAHSLWTTAVEHARLSGINRVYEGRIRNAMYESCLVHARLLADFLDKKPSSKGLAMNDAHAVHYDESWRSSDTLTAAEASWINQRIMHLSAERDGRYGDVNLIDIADRVLNVLDNFIASISDLTVRDWFSKVATEREQFAHERQSLG